MIALPAVHAAGRSPGQSAGQGGQREAEAPSGERADGTLALPPVEAAVSLALMAPDDPPPRGTRGSGADGTGAGRRFAAPNRIVTAAMAYYRPRLVLEVRNGSESRAEVPAAVGAAGTPTTVVDLSGAGDPPAAASALPYDAHYLVSSGGPQHAKRLDSAAAVGLLVQCPPDIVHIDTPRADDFARYFPLLSPDGVLFTNGPPDDLATLEAAVDYADEHDLIAIRQLGKIALSRVDIVALFGFYANGFEVRDAC